ncbi:hypothetical protein, partial [Ramlibacter alkalitolerans]
MKPLEVAAPAPAAARPLYWVRVSFTVLVCLLAWAWLLRHAQFDALGAQAAQVGAGVVDRVHHGLEVAVGAVKDGTGREHARAEQPAGFHQLGLREHRLGVG